MEYEDEREAETTRMAQELVKSGDVTTVQQDAGHKAEAGSWMQNTGKSRKKWFLQPKCDRLVMAAIIIILIIIIITAFVRHDTSHHGKIPPDPCPSGWIGYKRKCYFISEEEENWIASQSFCTKNQSSLAIFEDWEEMHSFVKHLRRDKYWIGLRKKGESFYWENGVRLEVDLFQVDNRSECAYLVDSVIYTSSCSMPRRYICVHPLNQ